MSSDYNRIAKAIEFIATHFEEQPGLERVAEELGLSPHHLQRLFTRWVGVSPKKFLQYLTLGRAKICLEENRSVLDAAHEAGLSGPGRLHDLFVAHEAVNKIHNNNIETNLLLIKKDDKSGLCLTCHTDKQYLADTKHNLIHSAPEEKNLEGKTVREAGICSPCHLPHKESRKAGEGPDFTTQLCMSCHKKGDIAEKAIPADYKHPVDVNPFEVDNPDVLLTTIGVKKEDLTLPLFNKNGAQDKNGTVTCATCHDPHRWRSDTTEGEIRKDVKGDNTTSFLRRPSPSLR